MTNDSALNHKLSLSLFHPRYWLTWFSIALLALLAWFPVKLRDTLAAYFGGYMNDNYQALADFLMASNEQVRRLALNSVKECWLPEKEEEVLRSRILAYV